MPRYLKGPPKPLNPTGHNCEGCPYRGTSIGYCPEDGDLSKAQYLFLLEAPGDTEIQEGKNACGPTGKKFDYLLKPTGIKRSEQVVANTCRCWPVGWEANGTPTRITYNKKIGERWFKYTTYKTEKPSPGQVRECAARYTNSMIDSFSGKYIIGLGKVPTSFMLGGNVSIKEKRGTPYVSGLLVACPICEGEGSIERGPVKCKSCKDGKLRCPECGRWKHLKGCSRKDLELSGCNLCGGTGQTPRTPRNCKECSGSGKVPKDPKNPFICDKLKVGQIFFPTYHPAALMRQPTLESVVQRDFSLLTNLEDITNPDEEMLEYYEFPEREIGRRFIYEIQT